MINFCIFQTKRKVSSRWQIRSCLSYLFPAQNRRKSHCYHSRLTKGTNKAPITNCITNIFYLRDSKDNSQGASQPWSDRKKHRCHSQYRQIPQNNLDFPIFFVLSFSFIVGPIFFLPSFIIKQLQKTRLWNRKQATNAVESHCRLIFISHDCNRGSLVVCLIFLIFHNFIVQQPCPQLLESLAWKSDRKTEFKLRLPMPFLQCHIDNHHMI